MTALAREPLSAAIDLGTNTFLMLVGRIDARGALEVFEDLCRTPRLGAGLARTGALAEDAIERGLLTLEEFRARIDALAIAEERLRVVGTAALRRASNAARFIARAEARCRLRVEVLDEDDEARLGYSAVTAEGASAESVIVDIGGGSTEVVAGGGRTRVSVPLGAVVATERWHSEFDAAVWRDADWAELEREIERAYQALPRGAAAQAQGLVIVLGGTGANLACLELALEGFDPLAGEGREFDVHKVPVWAERLRRLDAAARLRLPIERERASILPAGLACLAGALAALGASRLRVTGRGLRYGVLRELAGRRSES